MKLIASFDQLASLVHFHRKRAGLSQIDLASMAGVSRKVVQDVEAGREGVSWRNLRSLLTVLNIQLKPEGPLIDEWLSQQESTLTKHQAKE